jgi:Cof subfamily protein (haloacid dehalogenase superfamily)
MSMQRHDAETLPGTAGPYRLLFLDVDGTLVTGTDALTPRTLGALRRAQQAGCTPVICTGRSRYTARHIASQVGGHGYGIFLNGGILFDGRADATIRKVSLPADVARDAIRLMHAFELAPLCFAVEEDDRWVYTDRRFPALPQYVTQFPERMRTCDTLDWGRYAPPVSIETYGPEDTAIKLVTAWRQAFGEGVIAYTWAATRYGCRGVHIHSSEVDKGRGAEAVAARLGVPREQTLAIGDEVNDVEMLRWAGLGVAMGNGHADCLACADHVTGTVEDDGVAQVIERFILQGPGVSKSGLY